MFSKYDVYVTVQSVYCYPDTSVLKNKLHITDGTLLKQAEEEITAIKLFEMLKSPVRGSFTKNHLMTIHKYIFDDLYPFAGKIRTESISKLDTMFCHPNAIDQELSKLFSKLKQDDMLHETAQEQIFENLAYIMAELNVIHPFREGNGRSIREFIRLMAKRLGYSINWGNIGKEELLDASIQSVNDYHVLIPVLKQCVQRI